MLKRIFLFIFESMSFPPYLGTLLNCDQLEAVTHRDGPLLVVAGAGTGKTRILEYRVLNLIEAGVEPENILLLTFTREAATEMLTRVSALNELCRNVEGGTFHSFALKMLRQMAERSRNKHPVTVIDEQDAIDLLRKIINKKSEFVSLRSISIEVIYNIISKALTRVTSVENVVNDYYPDLKRKAGDIQSLKGVFELEKFRFGFCTYDDLLYQFYLLLKNPDYLKEFSQQYQYIMVDEYQDTNRLQAALVNEMAKLHRNILVVGDDAQSIFGFAGSDGNVLREFQEKHGENNVLVLSYNYRSTQAILNLANAITRHMPGVIPRNLKAAHNFKEAEAFPSLHIFRDEKEEAKWLADTILNNHYKAKTPLNEQCVLFRNTYLSNILQAELTSRHIPFTLKGGTRFIELPHVKDVMAFFRVLRKPGDILAWRRILELESSVSESTIEGVERLAAEGMDLTSLIEADWSIETKRILGLSVKNKANDFVENLKKLFRDLIRCGKIPGNCANKIIHFYKPYLFKRYMNYEDNLKDLKSLKLLARSHNSMETFIDTMTLESPHRVVYEAENGVDSEMPKLVLSTIHSAKGREWNTVYILGVADGQLPDYRSIQDEEKLKEEQRLLYVAVTRAKARLYLLMNEGTNRRGRALTALSRFLAQSDVLQHLSQPTHQKVFP